MRQTQDEKVANEIVITREDCMCLMARYSDGHFELAVVDPPFGDASGTGTADERRVARTGGTWAEKYGKGIKVWDVPPTPEYFIELFRVSRRQIIWGGNYFSLPPSRNFIVWRKLTISENFTMAMAEYAWTNIPGNAKVFDLAPQDPQRFHPTQKPVALYKWLLSRYAKPGWKILDTHLGSGSIAIACHDLGFDLTASEIDTGYFAAALRRLDGHRRRLRLPLKITRAESIRLVDGDAA
jgi:site-specific DNA-methyltransferase (adenine-specific)